MSKFKIASTKYKYYKNMFFTILKSNAKARNIEVNITKEDCIDKLIDQRFKCALSGIDIHLSTSSYAKIFQEETTASLDRIDNSKGYEKDNIRWVHKIVNIMKNKWSDEELFYWCSLVDYHNSKYTG